MKREGEHRSEQVTTRLEPQKLAQLDAVRGEMPRGAWLRMVVDRALGEGPAHEIRVDGPVWVQLGRIQTQLFELLGEDTHPANGSAPAGGGHVRQGLQALRQQLRDLRQLLLGHESVADASPESTSAGTRR